MSKVGEGVEEIPPPPKGDASGGRTTPVDGSSKDCNLCAMSNLCFVIIYSQVL
jgi:hypothetical protein